MSDIFNTIEIGFPWTQAIDLPTGTLPSAGDTLRVEFRYTVDDALPIFSLTNGDGITNSGDAVSMAISKTKTALIAAPPSWSEGEWILVADLVKVAAGGTETHLGVRLYIPAVLSATRPL